MISVGAQVTTRGKRGRKRSPRPIEVQFRTIVSPHQLNSRWGRRIYWIVLAAVLLLFTLAFVFPLYWMVTGALKTPEELAQMPPTLFPADPTPDAFFEAWDLFDIGTLLLNTGYYSLGGWIVCMAVDVSAAYALSKLRPMFGNVILGMMLATLMIPAMVVLIPLYVTVVDLGLLNSPWALWLPAAANGFNIFLLKRFFDSIPRELIEAAQIDGAGAVRTLRSVVLPISRPILGVVSIFTIVTSFKDFVWPLLVMTDSDKMTISVGLSQTAGAVTQNQVMGGLLITSIPMIIVFFIFQRHIMAGLTAGSIKG
ncbi:carbohydrate ABC transporter permease [Nonomuraea gerenzanensis]|uniref:Membrane transport protein n=1 Tax=Nonomuraea gerenzanensis TaxID=93944 RepID=A0A1M4E1U6_9ACTN|nr:carbohydrate ABC transporter permease [Nonomuraea gerenzanensis]UBU15046.1 carbohydrate ABC transporter permease [Nonomuraea gerenzanensis]SBO92789.1 membrane transport protein [Nonomuraea gerenzanensis]